MFKLILLVAGVVSSQKTCPPVKASCFFTWGTFAPNSPSTYPCWKKEQDWKCKGYLDEKRKVCEKDYVDVFTCNYPVKTPECPAKGDYCVSGDIAHRATDSDAPNCWFQREGGHWECHSAATCDAKKGLIDIKTCFNPSKQN
ncbi:hypothetical protein DSO57_1015243 [Entomophthora muscae]|uniref:Uncharacterized protein n=1 Tax=Entomophthora muscae TaxID=34485 RepID=A0ACC2SI42_9FUNG|nr:hypothetical protein DSO57_1015243 [Entomophthora muscae]